VRPGRDEKEEHMGRGRHRVVLATVLTVVTAALAFPLAAGAHNGLRKITLTPGTSSSARTAYFHHTGSFDLTMYAYFGRVTRTSAYLDHVTIRTCPVKSIQGGVLFAYNSGETHKYTADASRTYFSCGSFTQQIDQTFNGGYAGGNVAVTVEKRNIDPYCSMVACDMHSSTAVFYVP
jgi:hypothetical protein